MRSARMLLGLCIAFLPVFAVVLAGSSNYSKSGTRSFSPSADPSSGVKVLIADGTEPQPSPMPVPRPWFNLMA
jgi:hypothetical protein